MKIFTIFCVLIGLFSFSLQAEQQKNPEVGIVEKLDNTIPKDLKFVNSNGDTVKLGDIITKPTVLTLVFYHCTGICSPLLTNLAEVVDKTDLQPGKDYQLITVSFDHYENIEAAQRWRKTHLEEMKKQINPDDWRFLVGDSASIRKLCDAVGFYFKPDGHDNFIHAGSLFFISDNGKITRYLFGTEYNPFDFKLAILEAHKGLSMPTVNRMLKFCYSYDPDGRKYVFNITRIIGTGMLLILGIFFATLFIVKSKKKKGDNNE